MPQNYPYMTNPAKISKFLQHAQTAKVPSRVTLQYLLSAGFKSKNDRPLIPIMKFIGFLDSSAAPTKMWQAYRDPKQAPGVLAEALKIGYSDLFAMYEDACQRDDATLESFFSSQTSVGKATIRYMVQTFKAICKLADFSMIVAEMPSIKPVEVSPLPQKAEPVVRVSPGLQLNVEIHIAADTADEKIETILKNMKKYLLSNE